MYFDYFHIQWVFDLVMDLWKVKYILLLLYFYPLFSYSYTLLIISL